MCLVIQVYVLKRPHVDEFLQTMGNLFECVLFTASLGKVRVHIIVIIIIIIIIIIIMSLV